MRTNVAVDTSLDNIINKLEEAQRSIKEALSLSLDKISEEPNREDEIIKLWIKYSEKVTNFFMEEIEKTDKKHIIKKIFKYAVFKI
ncbi:MAG: hypothetical protein N2486_06180 [Caloramator sp.]|nr:hypothetical protein [Caloramator sp.]